MKLTRREFLTATGLGATAACGDGLDDGSDAEADSDFDPSPDPVMRADGGPPTDGALDDALDPDGASTIDGGAAVDEATPADGGAAVDAAPRPDAGATDSGVGNAEFRDLPQRDARFPVGVMAGDADASSAMFWTRYTGSAPLVLRVLEMDGTRVVARRFDDVVPVARAGYVRVVVTGLQAGARYRYAFLETRGGVPVARSAIGRVRTAIARDALEPLTFGGTSCTSLAGRPYPALARAAARSDLDFFIHAGDHVYADAGVDAVTLSQYRAKYDATWAAPGMRALHGSTGLYCSWDDHEVRNNWNPETFPASRLASARQAFFEYRATRKNASVPTRLWRSFRWGRTAEIFVLDTRSERRPSTRSSNPSRNSVYISRAQMDWLKRGLAASDAVFKFIVNSVPIADRPAGNDGDCWTGYASQRREILEHITDRRLRGVVWLSGDVHYGAVGRVERDGPFRNIWEVFMGPGGSVRESVPFGRSSQWPVLVVDKRNFTVLRADPRTRRLGVEFIGENGARIANSSWSTTV